MVMGHIGFGSYFDYFIHAFHMPMFFFVSGMFFNANKTQNLSFWNYSKRIAKKTLIPYIVFGLLHYAVWLIINYDSISIMPLLHLLTINTDGLPIAGALWFLTAFLFMRIIYFALRKYIKKKIVQHILVVIIALFGCLATTILPFRLPWALDAAFVGVGMMHIGYMLRHSSKRIAKRCFELTLWQWLITALVTVVLIFVNGYVNMRTGMYAIVPLFWINAVLAILVGINLSQAIVNVLPEKVWIPIASIGKNSIVYLCLNQIVILAMGNIVGIIVTNDLLERIIVLIFTMIVLYLCTHLIVNTKLKVLIGK